MPVTREWTFWGLHRRILEETKVAQHDREVTIMNNTTARLIRVGHDDPSCIIIKHHNTDIIRLYDDGCVSLDNGGWTSATTKARMNYVLRPLGLSLWSRNKTWVVGVPGLDSRTFRNGVLIDTHEWKREFEAAKVKRDAIREGTGR